MSETSKISRLAEALGRMGVWPLTRILTRDELRVFMYHRFSGPPTPRRVHEAALRAQVEAIKENFEAISFSTAVERIARGPRVNDKPAVCLTVDDGYVDFYEHAWPILREYSMPCTVFVTAGVVGERSWFWTDAVEYLVARAAAGNYEIPILGRQIPFTLGNSVQRRDAWRAIAAPLVFNNEARTPAIQYLERLFSVSLPKEPPHEFAAMTWEQLREVSSGGIEIGAHTWTHAFLPGLDRDSLQFELVTAKQKLEEQLGKGVCTFAYPNGSQRDSPPELVTAVSGAGYTGAAVAYKPDGSAPDTFRVGRWPGGVNMTYFNNVLHGTMQLKHRLGSWRARA